MEIAKERLYQPEKHGKYQKLSGQYTIFNVLFEMLQMYNIFVPHITEYIYQEYYKDYKGLESLALCQIEQKKHSEEDIAFGEKVIEVVSEVRKLKAQLNVSMKEPIKAIRVYANSKDIKKFEATKLDLIAVTSAEEIVFEDAKEFKVEINK